MSTTDPAEATTDAPAAEARVPRIQRLRISINILVQTLLMLVLFGLANYLASRHFKQWDHTFDRKFTLAPSTEEYLKKVTVPITITALTVRGSDTEKDLSALLQQYQNSMKGRVVVKVIDTRRDVQAYEQFKAQLFKSKLSVDTNGILVQADNPGQSKSGQNAYKFITEESLYEMDPVKKTATAFKGESLLNAAIRGLTSLDRPVIGIVAGLGNWRVMPDRSSVYDILKQISGLQNVDLEPFPIRADGAGSNHLSGLLWISPIDITEREQTILADFFETPGRSLMIMLNPASRSPNLDKFLAAYGIAPQEDRVLIARNTSSGPVKRFDVEGRFLDGSSLTTGIVSQNILFLDQTRSLKLATGTDKQRNENIEVKPLISPPADYWGEMDFEENLPSMTKGRDNGGPDGPPIYLAVAAERGAAKDPRVQVKSSRLLVFGNSALGDPDAISPQSYDFLTRSMNWMLHRDVVAPNDSATDKIKHRFRIMIKPEQYQRIFWTTTIILPLAALMTGLMVWSSRRN
jgi:hypothetical protein